MVIRFSAVFTHLLSWVAALNDVEKYAMMSRYESRKTRAPELTFGALLGDDGPRDIRSERAGVRESRSLDRQGTSVSLAVNQPSVAGSGG